MLLPSARVCHCIPGCVNGAAPWRKTWCNGSSNFSGHGVPSHEHSGIKLSQYHWITVYYIGLHVVCNSHLDHICCHGFYVIQLRLALTTMLNLVPLASVVMCGIVCKSFVCISSGTHQRAPWCPLGKPGVKMVEEGNLFMSRTPEIKTPYNNFWEFAGLKKSLQKT